MAAFLSQTELSRGGLRLFLSNSLGQAQDALSVRWTVYSASGVQISGKGLQAIKSTVGEYYAPWFTDAAGGSYRIDWEIQESMCSDARVLSDYFFVVNPEMYTACGINPNVVVGKGTFKIGQQLGQNDLTLFLKNSDGFLQDAFAVFWTIRNSSGCAVTPRSYAASSGMGSYFAPWLVSATESGDYSILWEFQENQDAPLQSATQGFYVLTPTPSYTIVLSSACTETNPQSCTEVVQTRPSPVFIIPCGGGFTDTSSDSFACGSGARCAPCPPPTVLPPTMPNPEPKSCCAFEVPRIVHIPTGILPANGAYTSQPQYPIPTSIRRITFYVTYTRGAPGGFAAFKLLWGNGTEEIQETILDKDLEDGNSAYSVQQLLLQEMDGPVPTDGLPVSFSIELTVPGGSNRVRLLAAEKGMPGIPGIIGVTLTAST